eukprot:CAMPEP_0177458586 /NCGR_PEP_ID=MMETSP0369-20130122/13632_1 /TAXON_ID=447022 ORGANISM="Scrippsiella hangoei-like, Strain SHHI-4" /NCGR_SAMPLE_ID=MMETSP0369 /ASSEMBLY_ACC=CAM_ASM_000364 /LENGTH=86 /DNA_ID=CAMNT_0018931759 /DNA_START=25 /DNA_END=282 /DNA_ORIENTATION=+
MKKHIVPRSALEKVPTSRPATRTTEYLVASSNGLCRTAMPSCTTFLIAARSPGQPRVARSRRDLEAGEELLQGLLGVLGCSMVLLI